LVYEISEKCLILFFFSSRRRHTRSDRDWSSDVCSSDLTALTVLCAACLMLSHRAAAAPDLSTPKKAAVAFAKAVEGGNTDEIKRSEERRVGKECRKEWSTKE